MDRTKLSGRQNDNYRKYIFRVATAIGAGSKPTHRIRKVLKFLEQKGHKQQIQDQEKPSTTKMVGDLCLNV